MLSDGAFRLYITGLCYAGKHLTDGFLPAPLRRTLGTELASKWATKLTEKGLWIKVEGGYQIHDYLKHQTSKAQAEMEKENNRLRAARARAAKSEAIRNGVTNGKRSGEVTLTDTPTPTDSPTDNKKNIKVIKDDPDFEVFWSQYPKKVKKQPAKKSWQKAIKSATLQQILEGLSRYLLTCGDDPRYIQNPDAWLNQQRWNDEVVVSATKPARSKAHHKVPMPGAFGEFMCGLCQNQWPCPKSSENAF